MTRIPPEEILRLFILVKSHISSRLDPASIDDAIEYLNHNERGLAFEILMSLLHDRNIRISAAEYALLDELREACGLPQSKVDFLDSLLDNQ